MPDPNSSIALRDRSAYENPGELTQELAAMLRSGRLMLVLGAGASVGYGLPEWDELVEKAFAAAGAELPEDVSKEQAADILLDVCNGDDEEFAGMIRSALYADEPYSFKELRDNDLLVAIGALSMTSVRGSIRGIVSFNFDDLLECYLGFHGFVVQQIARLPTWSPKCDVAVYHPHGVLPFREPERSTPIVFTERQYDRVVGQTKHLWRSFLVDVFSSNMCLFVGLSGDDANLRSVLAEVSENHAGHADGQAFWGVRFSDDTNDSRWRMWEDYGVFQWTLSDYDELPGILLELCKPPALV